MKRKYWIVINGSGCHEMHLTREAAESWSSGEDEIVEVEEVLKDDGKDTDVFCSSEFPDGKL